MVTFQEVILNQSIAQLDFSNEFKITAETLGFYALSDLLQYRTHELEGLPGFTILLIHEYVSFVEQQGLGCYIDPV
jgi:hypothetical protein